MSRDARIDTVLQQGVGAGDWVGRIIEAVSGERLDAYFREHIFAPLGMDDTGFVASPAQRARQAFVHQQVEAGCCPRAATI